MALVDAIDSEVGPLGISEQIQRDKLVLAAKSGAAIWKEKAEHLAKELELSEKRNAFHDAIIIEDVQEQLKRLKPSGDSTAVLVLSDWHVEETVDPATVNGLNEFNLTVAEKRIEKMFERSLLMLDVARGLTKIKDLVIAALGDFITGYIHEELEEGNGLSPIEATLFAGQQLLKGIKFLKREGKFKSIVIPTAYGNHGRVQKQKRISTGAANSHEWGMYNTLAMYAAQPGVTWKIERSYHNWLDIQGHRVRFHHGDAMNYGGGVGGITIPINKALSQWNKVQWADYDFFGHFHQWFNTIRATCNSSVIGYGPYALSIKAECEPPSQTLSVISRDRGKILTERVFCD